MLMSKLFFVEVRDVDAYVIANDCQEACEKIKSGFVYGVAERLGWY